MYDSELLGSWTFSIVRCSKNKKTQHFGNYISFRPQVTVETYTLLGSLKRANVNHWTTHVMNSINYNYVSKYVVSLVIEVSSLQGTKQSRCLHFLT
jgi:hypothetical protein